jgi:hypothetical protein
MSFAVRSPRVSGLFGHGKGYVFETDCIHSDGESIRALVESEKPISLRTFRSAIGIPAWKELQDTLGYDRHFPISRDWHIGFYKGVYRDRPAVFARWSAIEYIFVKR